MKTEGKLLIRLDRAGRFFSCFLDGQDEIQPLKNFGQARDLIPEHRALFEAIIIRVGAPSRGFIRSSLVETLRIHSSVARLQFLIETDDGSERMNFRGSIEWKLRLDKTNRGEKSFFRLRRQPRNAGGAFFVSLFPDTGLYYEKTTRNKTKDIYVLKNDDESDINPALKKLPDRELSLKDVFDRLDLLTRGDALPLPAHLLEVFEQGPRIQLSLVPTRTQDRPVLRGRFEIVYGNSSSSLEPETFRKIHNRLEQTPAIEERRAITRSYPSLARFPLRLSGASIAPAIPAILQSNTNPFLAFDRQALIARRDPIAEEKLRDDFPRAFQLNSRDVFLIRASQIPSFLSHDLPLLETKGISLRIHHSLGHIFGNPPRLEVKLQPAPFQEYFEGKITVRGMGKEDRLALFRAAQERRPFLRLANGAWVSLEQIGLTDILASTREFGIAPDENGEFSNISAGQAAGLGNIFGERANFRKNSKLARFLQGLGSNDAMTASEMELMDLSFLRPYQLQGVEFMRRLYGLGGGGILADDMGLGKTLQCLALVDWLSRADVKKTPGLCLTLAPLSALGVWEKEAARFFPDLEIHNLRDKKVTALPTRGLALTTYQSLKNIFPLFQGLEIQALFLDEAQWVNNHRSRTYRLIARLNTRSTICLTGTPLENNLGELWSLLHLAFPGAAGRRLPFLKKYGEKKTAENHNENSKTNPTPDAGLKNDILQKRIAPFILRRTRNLVMPDLPPITETGLAVPMSRLQRLLYEQARREALREIKAAGTDIFMTALPWLTRLRRIACHPHIDRAQTADPLLSGKLERLSELTEELARNSRGVLIFSQFRDVLTLAGRLLESQGLDFFRLDGETPARDRNQMTHDFQENTGRVKFFLISLKAGGTALTLHRADTVIHLDPWWNPAAESQASARAHRPGQTAPVFVYRLFSEGSVEQKVIALQARKRRLFNDVFNTENADRAFSGRLDAKEILALFERRGTV